MNIITKLTLSRQPKITLRDLVKPGLNKQEQAAIKRALKNAQKDQEKLRHRAAQV